VSRKVTLLGIETFVRDRLSQALKGIAAFEH
jgi:hypothetical protein